MEFYTSIAEQYDTIFPLNPEQEVFTLQHISPSHAEKEILDVGCGTGSLAVQLAPKFKRVVGIDLDDAMIDKARKKARGEKGNCSFDTADMAQLTQKFSPASFDAIFCYGNTIVHLDDGNRIESFIQQVNKCLKPGGEFLFQIIHYDKILKEDINKLPTIETDEISFKRKYMHLPMKHKIRFDTVLTLKKSNEKIKNSVLLYPLTKGEIIQALANNGFTDVLFYGDFKGNALIASSLPLVVSCRKRL